MSTSSGPGIHDYEQINAGITFLWNNRFEEAEKIFGSQKDKVPRYALHYSEVSQCTGIIFMLKRSPSCALLLLQMQMILLLQWTDWFIQRILLNSMLR